MWIYTHLYTYLEFKIILNDFCLRFFQIFSARELSDMMNRIKDTLSDPNHDTWEKRVDSVSHHCFLLFWQSSVYRYSSYFPTLAVSLSIMYISILYLYYSWRRCGPWWLLGLQITMTFYRYYAALSRQLWQQSKTSGPRWSERLVSL